MYNFEKDQCSIELNRAQRKGHIYTFAYFEFAKSCKKIWYMRNNQTVFLQDILSLMDTFLILMTQ